MKVKYRFRDLAGIYNDLTAKMSGGEGVDDYEAKLGAAAGYAMDLIETARNAGTQKVRLDLTAETEKNIDRALMIFAMRNLENGMSEEECVQDLIKRASSYQLFTLCNLLTRFDTANDIVLDTNMSESLLIKTNKADDSETVVYFDPKKMMESVSDKCFKFVDVGFEHPAAMICLDWYKQLVSSELLWEIEEGTDDD